MHKTTRSSNSNSRKHIPQTQSIECSSHSRSNKPYNVLLSQVPTSPVRRRQLWPPPAWSSGMLIAITAISAWGTPRNSTNSQTTIADSITRRLEALPSTTRAPTTVTSWHGLPHGCSRRLMTRAISTTPSITTSTSTWRRDPTSFFTTKKSLVFK